MDLNYYLSHPPGIRLEFLEIDNHGYSAFLFPTICSFLNSEGGEIIVGLSREKISQQLTSSTIDFFITGLNEGLLHNKALLNPSRGLQIDKMNHDSDHFAVVKILQSPEVHRSAGRFYKRIGDLSKWLIDSHEIEELFLSKRPSTETKLCYDVQPSDLDFNLLQKARSIINLRDSNHRWLTMGDAELINESQLAVFDRSHNRNVYTLAAVLLIGKEATINRILPGYKLDIFIRKVDVDRWDDRKTLRKNLIETRNDALDFIKSHLPEPFFSDSDQRKDLRDLIFREIIANVIIHREYTDANPTEIIVYKDSVRAKNPNKTHKSGQINPEDFINYAKNPFIRRFFSELGWSDEAGSGVRNVTKYLKEYVKGAAPSFIEDNPFLTIVPLRTYIIGDRSTILLDLFKIRPESIDEKLHTIFKNISLNPELDYSKDDDDFTNGFIGTIVKNNRNLVKTKLLKDTIIEKHDKKTIGTQHINDRNLVTLKGKKLVKVLIGLLVEKTIEEVRIYIESESTDSVWLNYLRVLKADDLISFTNPDVTNDPGQKYIITDKGKRLLGGLDI